MRNGNVHSYMRARAIRDGVLIDVTETAREAHMHEGADRFAYAFVTYERIARRP